MWLPSKSFGNSRLRHGLHLFSRTRRVQFDASCLFSADASCRQNFEISIANGGAFSTLYETAVNSLNKTALVIEGEAAKALRIRMREVR